MRRGILIGCGGLLGLVVLLFIIAAIVGGGQETAKKSTEDKEQAKEEKPAKKSEEAPVGRIGEAVAVGDATGVITDARRANQLTSSFREVKQGNFVIVDFNFRNDGNEAQTLHQAAINLFDAAGRESNPDTDAFGYIPSDKNIFLKQVNPGVTEDGQVVFTVAPDASNFELELRDTNLFSANKARVGLGF